MTSSKFDKNRTQGTVWCIGATRSTVDVERVLGPSFLPLPTMSRNACFSAPNLGLWEWEGRWLQLEWMPLEIDSYLELQKKHSALDDVFHPSGWHENLPRHFEVFLHNTGQPGKTNLASKKTRHDILCSTFAGKRYQKLVPYSNLPEILPQKEHHC